MKCVKTLLKLAAALATVGGALFVVYKYWDKIMEKLDALKGKCFICTPNSEEEPEEVPAGEAPVQEPAEPAQEEAPEEAPAEEAAPAEEETVTEADFAE